MLSAARYKAGVFTEEPIAGMDRISTALPGNLEDFILIQIGIPGSPCAQGKSLICNSNVKRFPISFGIDRDGGDAHFFQGARYTNRDGAAIRNQYTANFF
jgi:hypothetical protein